MSAPRPPRPAVPGGVPIAPAPVPGTRIVRLAVLGTAVFVVAAVAAAIAPDTLAAPVAGLDLVLFVLGCAAFVWSFAKAVVRSRTEEIAVTSLYFLAGSAPPGVRRVLLGALAVQVVVAVATASVRPFTPLAFGILVPVFGLGLCGAWAAGHGSFPARRDP